MAMRALVIQRAKTTDTQANRVIGDRLVISEETAAELRAFHQAGEIIVEPSLSGGKKRPS